MFWIVVLVSIGAGGCSSGGGDSANVDGADETGGAGNFFYSSATEVAPTINSSASSLYGIQGAGALPSGSILAGIYLVLRDYQFPRDEGVIDMHNIYKTIHTAGQIYSTAEDACETISETAVASPYDLGVSDTYTCAGNSNTMDDNYANGFAIKESGNTKYGLLTYRWAPNAPTQQEHGILQGMYDSDDGTLRIDMIHNVYYESQEGFVVRSFISGNVQTHEFVIRLISSGTGDDPSWISLVGKGISQGTGNTFLFKVRNSSGVDGNYFCFPASATESTLETMHAANPSGLATVDENCASYQTAVDAMTFLTTDDVPKSIDDFTGSSILISY